MTLVLLNDEAPAQVVARVPEGEARREHRLRDLIHDHPGIMPVHDLDPSFGRLFTVAKELYLPGAGFVDVLLADERGRLVIIECKLWRNPQARREVVGQIIDYARELSRYSYEGLQRQISVATRRDGNVLYALAQAAGTPLSEAQFVDRISRDLASGRFMLLVVGDGIAEGTRRIGEYLRAQPGLAFDFGLVELAEYRLTDVAGDERTIMHPRVLAQTAVIERHVIRAEVPGLVIDELVTEPPNAGRPSAAAAEAGQAWRNFVDRFVADARFDDPGQPAPRSGGNGWIKLPLPDGLYVNLYRSAAEGRIGAQVRFTGSEGAAAFATIIVDREAIDHEFVAADLPPPDWTETDVPLLSLVTSSPAPWNEAAQAEQRIWLTRAGNQFVNSLRPRLERREA